MPERSPIPTSSSERIFGLDVLRATAIALVIVAHSGPLLSRPGGGAWWFPRIDGVDLFFVLSGFLVGGLLLRDAGSGPVAWQRRLLDFWQRRWLRTLPDYFLFLVINVVLVRVGIAPGLVGKATVVYAVFLQNFHVPFDLFFWESWSLAVEEWFYLLLPMLIAGPVVVARVPSGKAYLLAALSLCAIPLLIRLDVMRTVTTAAEVDLHVRKLVITRLDAIAIGALAAWAMTSFPRFWKALRWPLFACGLVALVVCSEHRPDPVDRGLSALYFTLIPLTIACLLPLLSTWRSTSLAGRPIVLISRCAYALYLVHMPLLYAFQHASSGLPSPGPVLVICYWAVCLAVSFGVLHTVELPFMRLRDRVGQRIRATDQRPITPP